MRARTPTYYRAVAQRNGGHFELFIPQRDPELAFSYAEWACGSHRMQLLRVQYAGRIKPAAIGQWSPFDPSAEQSTPMPTRPRPRARVDPRQGSLF